MVTVRLDGKKIACPSCYEQLKTGVYQRAISEWEHEKPLIERDFFKLFSILTETDFNIVPSVENEQTIWNAVQWFVTEAFRFSSGLPKVIQIGDKIVDVPPKIGALSIGQNILLRQAIEKCKYAEESISNAMAICLQPLYNDGPFNPAKVDPLERLISEMPIYLTHPIGFFFLQTAGITGRKHTSKWHRLRDNLKQTLSRLLPRWQRWRSYASSTIYH
jgi:hypothetical protein